MPTSVSAEQVRISFRNTTVTPGQDVTTDITIRPGPATSLQVFYGSIDGHAAYYTEFIGGASFALRNFSLRSSRPIFQFLRNRGIIAQVQFEFRSGHVGILGSHEGNVVLE